MAMVMPTSLNVEIPHSVSAKIDKIFISVTASAPGMCKYCKLTLPTAAFPDL